MVKNGTKKPIITSFGYLNLTIFVWFVIQPSKGRLQADLKTDSVLKS
jgi:hypothetical protein